MVTYCSEVLVSVSDHSRALDGLAAHDLPRIS